MSSGTAERPGGFGGNLFVAAMGAFLVLAAMAVVQQDWLGAGIALAGLVASSRSAIWGVATFVVALVLGAPWVALAGLVAAASYRIQLTRMLRNRRKVDRVALGTAVATLPGDVVEQLRQASDGRTITTREMLLVARQADPGRWKATLSADPGVGAFDGPEMQIGEEAWSQFAAEAVVMARQLADSLRRTLDSDVLGAAATLIPMSAAEDWAKDRTQHAVLRVSVGQLFEAVRGVHDLPGARHLLNRYEVAGGIFAREGEPDRRKLAEFADLSPSRRWWTLGVVGAQAVGETLRDAARERRSRRRQPPTVTVPAPVPVVAAARTPTATERPRPATRAEPPASKAPRERLPTPWSRTPAEFQLVWVGMRAALAISAVVAAALTDDAGVLWTLLIAAVAAGVRSLRRPFIPAAAALAVAVISPLAAVLLLTRSLIGEIAIRRLGRGGDDSLRRAGADRMVAARRRFLTRIDLPAVSVTEAREGLREATSAADDEDAIEHAFFVVAAAWAEFRAATVCVAAVVLVRGTLTGVWRDAALPGSVGGDFRRLFVFDAVAGVAARVLFVLASGAIAVVAGPSLTAEPTSHLWSAHIEPGAVALLIAIPVSRRRFGYAQAAVTGLGGWALMGSEVVGPLVIGVIGGLLARAARTLVSNALLRGDVGARAWQAPSSATRSQRAQWRAAELASSEGRGGVFASLLSDLAHSSEPAIRSEAQSRLALAHLDAGALSAASDALDQALAHDAAPTGSRAVAAGLVTVALGERKAGRAHLDRAVGSLPRRSPLLTRGLLALAEVCADLDDIDGATAAIKRLRGRTFAIPGAASMFEADLALAAALDRDGQTAKASARIEEILTWSFADDLEMREHGGQKMSDAVARSEARAHLLKGRMALDTDDLKTARTALEEAVARLTLPRDAGLRATAEILFGVALVRARHHQRGVDKIRRGVDVLEERRTQLSVSDRRTAMLVADSYVYHAALSALESADDVAGTQSALIAGTLVESLRRSALSSVVRSGGLSGFAPAAAVSEPTTVEVDGGVPGMIATDVTQARAELARLASAEFAARYFPYAVTIDDLLATARQFENVLAFHVEPDTADVWRVWISADGEAQLDRIGKSDIERRVLDSLFQGETSRSRTTFAPWSDNTQEWEELAATLLPVALRARLADHPAGKPPISILVAPDGPLASIPWAALAIAGAPLVERAVVQLVPALDIAAVGRGTGPTARPRVLSMFDVTEALAVREVLAKHVNVDEAKARSAFVDKLASGGADGVFVTAHGTAMGLEQRLEFEDGSSLTAADALGYRWPSWAVFAACVVGRVHPRAGQEPLGLAISSILGGGSTVIAAVVELMPVDGPAVCADVAVQLAAGASPARALRDTQLALIADAGGIATLADGLGLVCISTRGPEAISS